MPDLKSKYIQFLLKTILGVLDGVGRHGVFGGDLLCRLGSCLRRSSFARCGAGLSILGGKVYSVLVYILSLPCPRGGTAAGAYHQQVGDAVRRT